MKFTSYISLPCRALLPWEHTAFLHIRTQSSEQTLLICVPLYIGLTALSKATQHFPVQTARYRELGGSRPVDRLCAWLGQAQLSIPPEVGSTWIPCPTSGRSAFGAGLRSLIGDRTNPRSRQSFSDWRFRVRTPDYVGSLLCHFQGATTIYYTPYSLI